MPARPFALPLPTPLAKPLESFLGLTTLAQLYDRRCNGDFIAETLRLLAIEVVTTDALDQIPQRGPVIIVANHPCGALDGLALAQLVGRRRGDVKVLANHLLRRIPELCEHVIAVNPFNAKASDNARGLRDARQWLVGGGAIIVFPAGEVSHVRQPGGGAVDGEWRRGVLTLIDGTDAAVVPAFVHGRNRSRFYLAGRIHPLLRTALLARELLARRGSRVQVSIGASIPADRLRQLADGRARLAYLRARTYALQHDTHHDSHAATETMMPIADAESPDALAAELAALPARARLLTSGPYEVYCANAAQVPAIVREIGRLREATFRLVGEGTGRERDLDEFDVTYIHLFVWHTSSRCVVGAYRLGLTDRLHAAADPRVLYTRTLFRFGPPLLRQLGAAIELGRSFVRAEFQRESNALLLLWRGIGAFVALEPRYRFLFGAVSISATYQSLTRQLLARFLSSGRFLSELARLVRPSRPLPVRGDATQLVRSQVVSSLEDVERIVAEVERGRGLPVLLRQYLRLNARLLGFSVDPNFGNVLDGLVLVDLLEVKPALLQRYLGRENAAIFLEYHGPRTLTSEGALQPHAAGQ